MQIIQSRILVLFLYLFSVFTLAGISFGQNEDAEEDSIFELSPFSVEEDSDIGYQATTTLAGSRLNTPLRDVGAPVSVLTQELFEDLGATDASSVLAYSTNMEVTGNQGNFAGGSGNIFYNTVDIRTTPQTSGQRVRGLATASLTRDYFLTDIPFDSYNTSRVTISRGPNSLLFGIGEVGGVIDNAVKEAAVSESFGELSVRLGEHGSHRETVDYNAALVPDRIGIRFAALEESTEYQQKPAFKDSERWYVALHSVLLKNENSDVLGPLTFKANYETGETVGNPVNIVPPTDGLTPWFSPPSYTPQQIRDLNDGVLPGRLSWMEGGGFVPKLTIDNRLGEFTSATIPNTGTQPWFFQLPVTYNDLNAQTASLGLPDASIAGTLGRVQWQLLDPQIPPYTRQYDFIGVTPVEQSGLMPGFVNPVIQNRNVLDNTKLMISGDGARVREDFDAKNFSLNQLFWEGQAGIQISFDDQRYENYSQLVHKIGQSNMIFVDINEYLGNLQPNPNVGRAFMMSQGNDRDLRERVSTTNREAYQVTAFYKLDFSNKDGFLKWLGRHTITGFLGGQEIDRIQTDREPVWNDVAGSSADIKGALAGPLLNGPRMRTMWVNYITPSLLGSEYSSMNDIQFKDYIRNPVPRSGDRHRQLYSHFRTPRLNTADNTPMFVDEFEVYYALIDGDHTIQEIDSEVISWQGQLLNDNLVAMVGWRTDESKTFSSPGNARTDLGEWDINNMEIDYASPDLNEGDTMTKSLVLHIPENWTESLPFNLSMHFSESENFTASVSRNDIQRNPLGNPSGETKDYGVTFNFLNESLSLRLNRFETSSSGITATGINANNLAGEYIGFLLRRIYENSLTLTVEEFLTHPFQPADAINRYSSYDEIYDDILDLSLAKSHGNQYALVDGENGRNFGDWLNPVDRSTVTTSFKTEGYEVELIGSITPQWQVFLNVSQQETVQSDTATLAAEVGFRLRDEIAASNLSGLFDSVTRNEPTDMERRLNGAILNGLTAQLARDGTISAEQRKHRVNLVSNYRFDEGLFSGFMIGGSLRWQDKAAVGYPTISVVEGAVTPDLANPFFDDPQLNGDLLISYEKALTDKIDWKIQLNVLNLIRDSDYIPVTVNPDGRAAVVRNPNPVDIFLTNTFSF